MLKSKFIRLDYVIFLIRKILVILSYWSPKSLYCKLCPQGYYSGFPLSGTTIQGAYNTVTSKCYFVSTTATLVSFTSASTTCTTVQTGPASGTAPVYDSTGIQKFSLYLF